MAMDIFIPILIAVALLAVVAVLVAGVVGMAKGGDFNRKYGNKLMRWRVALQGTAVLLVIAAAFLSRG